MIVFTQLSVLAFGGGNAILPEMQHQVVTVHQWMTAEHLARCLRWLKPHPPEYDDRSSYRLARRWAAGLLVTSLAKFGPSSIITILLKFWERFKSNPLRARFEKALNPYGRIGSRECMVNCGCFSTKSIVSCDRHFNCISWCI